jgi:hypothetical protein
MPPKKEAFDAARQVVSLLMLTLRVLCAES